jgi:hypothetical protein
MKKHYFTLFAVVASLGMAFSQACVIDTANTAFIAPPTDSFPCIERTVAFSHAIQLNIPSTFTAPVVGAITVDSVMITGISGGPVGISYTCNPATCVFPGGTKACINFSGTTTDSVKSYTVKFQGKLYYSPSNAFAPSPLDFATLAALPSAPNFGYTLDVINQGAACRGTASGIHGFSSELNSMMYIYPNPSNGVFEFKLDAGKRVNAELVVVDVTGKSVFTKKLDVVGFYNTTIDLSGFAKGLYAVQLRTDNGYASKNISIQ